jgi:hypothetical protein
MAGCMPNPDYDGESDDGATLTESSSADASTTMAGDDDPSASAPEESADEDTGVPPSCGNGIVEGIETCDDTARTPALSCGSSYGTAARRAWTRCTTSRCSPTAAS